MATPPGHRRYFMAKGSPRTPAPTMAVVLWNALYHLGVRAWDFRQWDRQFCAILL